MFMYSHVSVSGKPNHPAHPAHKAHPSSATMSMGSVEHEANAFRTVGVSRNCGCVREAAMEINECNQYARTFHESFLLA